VLEKCGMSAPADEGDTLAYVMSSDDYTLNMARNAATGHGGLFSDGR